MVFATPRHAMEKSLNTKSNRPPLPSCGAVGIATPTQRTKNRPTDISLEKMSQCSACDNLHNQKAACRTNQNRKALFRIKL